MQFSLPPTRESFQLPLLRISLASLILLILPVVVLPIIFPLASVGLFRPEHLISWAWLLALYLGLGGGMLVLYYLGLRRHFTPHQHPYRRKLVRAIPGLLTGLLLAVFGITPLYALLAGTVISLVVIFSTGKRLTLESLYAGLGTAGLYILLAALASTVIPTGADDLWFSANDSGFMVGPLPLVQVLCLLFLGLITAPLYLALKEQPLEDFDPTHAHKKVPLKLVSVGVVVLALLGAAGSVSYAYAFKPQKATLQSSQSLALDADIEVILARPLDRGTVLLSIEPATEGQWEFLDTSVGGRFFSQLRFQPDQPLKPDLDYKVTISGGRPLGTSETLSAVFRTEPLPKIIDITPAEGEISSCETAVVRFEAPLSGYWQPAFTITPSTTIETSVEGATYTLKPKDCWEQGTNYSLAVSVIGLAEGDEATILTSRSFSTHPAPGISGHAPEGEGITLGTSAISVQFTKAMSEVDTASFVSLSPALAGAWSWQEGGTKLLFTPLAKLQPATRYTVVVKKGLPDAVGGFSAEEASFFFTTIGPPSVSSVVPGTGSTGISPDTDIRVRFSQAVDKASAESRFSLEPAVAGNISWKGSELVFKPTNSLSYSTVYTYRIAEGVTSSEGLLTARATTDSFTVKAAPPPPPKIISFGQSQLGRTISGYVFGSGPRVVFMFGAIHGGKERSSGLLMERFVQELNKDTSVISKDKTIVIVPITNPDGYYGRTDKLNARDVNLNLNFDTGDWQPFGGDAGHSAGSEPFSEAESRVIRDIVLRYKPESMLSFHAIGPLVNPESHPASQQLAHWYAGQTGYPYFEDPSWDYFGTATRWFAERYSGGAITIELASYSVADWSRHKNALFGMVK